MRGTIAIVVGLLALGVSPEAAASGGNRFVVNDDGNSPDSMIGDSVCATSSGLCTLTAAIQEANATPALDTIAFAIGNGPGRIAVPFGLPPITSPVVIDGWTQPGFAGSPLIEIHGSILAGDGLRIHGGSSTLRGLVINGFGSDGVLISLGGDNVLEGNYIGTDITGMTAIRNLGAGVRIESGGNWIGGTTVAQRNVISGNGGLGIEGGVLIYGASATGNVVQGNFLGLDATGMNPIGNLGRGVVIHYASYNLVGGSQPGAGNLIAGNRASGVRIMAESIGNVVQRNWIGVNAMGQTRRGEWPQPGVLSNARGVQVRGDHNFVLENVIVGNTFDGVIFFDGTGVDLFPDGYPSNNIVYGNLVAGNGLNGIGAYVGTGNRFVGNSIFANQNLGINLANRAFDLVTVNDFGDVDEGTNTLQNHPTLTSATVGGAQTTISGTLDSRAALTYALEFYANPACSSLGHGQGRYLLGESSVTTDAAGAGSFTTVVPFAVPPGWIVSATATAPDGSTSEFSACVTVR